MPLRLKSLELHGYKTFAARTSFEFSEGITAIVGPNGSGKSNIADALRWVFGEQSYSLMRAKKTEDMIFAGSEYRPRLGMASVGVLFDNSNGWLPVDFSEVALARRSYRDGRNEYLLNNQHVRLKDIHEILAKSGLSERTYTILGQGLVDASLALKADERRLLFEEAAGIGLYRSRREEVLRRLDTTQRNLDRVLDILIELEPRLKSLERQAERAQEFSQLQVDLRLLLLEWYGFHWHRAQHELVDAMERSRSQENKLGEAQASYQQTRQALTTFREDLNVLHSRLNSWHRQASQLYESRETFSGELATLEERKHALKENHQASLLELSRLSEEIKVAVEQLLAIESERSRLQGESDEANAQVSKAQASLEERQASRSRIEAEIQAVGIVVDEFTKKQAGLQALLDEFVERQKIRKLKFADLEKSLISAQADAMKTLQEAEKSTITRQKIETELGAVEVKLHSSQGEKEGLENQLKEKEAVLNGQQAGKARFTAQIKVLEQAEQSLAGYADGVKLLLEASRHSELSGARGSLSSALDVPMEFEVAIAAALGEYVDAILLETGQDAERAIDLLNSDRSGRASLLPLDWLTPNIPLKMKKSLDCLGVASDLVGCTAEIRPVIDLLLGQVLIVKDRSSARRVLIGQPKSTLAVTLAGDVFHATGQVSAGRPPKVAALERPRLRRELQESLKEVDLQIDKSQSNITEHNNRLESANKKLVDCQEQVDNLRTRLESARNAERHANMQAETAHRQLEWQQNQKVALEEEEVLSLHQYELTNGTLSSAEKEINLRNEILRQKLTSLADLSLEELQGQVRYWTLKSAVMERALSDVKTRQSDRLIAKDHLVLQHSTLENRLKEIDRSIEDLENQRVNLHDQISGINAQIDELRSLIEPAEQELKSSEARESDLKNQEEEAQLALARVEKTSNQAQVELSRKQEMLESLRRRIEDDFGLVVFEYASDVSGPVPLPFSGLVAQLPTVKELPPDLEDNMTRLRAQLRRMGAINPEARQEYKSVKERHDFLFSQKEDLQKAEADLHQVIAELDEQTRIEFQKTFEAVAEQFHTIFHQLFGGGVARLVLTDPENLIETGIDIEARLPGRREQGLSLLSGGERSLTAIALVFSLLKVSPTPVCVMDEVDAMLDEANVARFRDLLLELSKDTQFIIITHNRNTVQAANVIYGVTMGRDSTSQIISLKLDEISEEYLK